MRKASVANFGAENETSGPHVIYGAGGHGRVVLDALLTAQKDVLGVLDDAIPPGGSVLGFPVLGGMERLEKQPATAVALGVGDNAARRRIAANCVQAGANLAVVVHPSAVVSRFASFAPGAVVLAAAVVNAGAALGKGCIVNSAAVVEHDAVVGDFAHVSPHGTIAGGARLGNSAHLGAAASILPGVTVGDETIVGAGAVVNRSLPARCVAVGVPARIVRQLTGP